MPLITYKQTIIDMNAKSVKQHLLSLGSTAKAEHSKYFFKTGKGEYGEGDRFIGCTVPETRSVAKLFKTISFEEIEKLLDDEMHECRLCALVILVEQFKKGSDSERQKIYEFYLSNTKGINNWDLVDLSSYHIVGQWLLDKDRSILYHLADSSNLWEQRIAIVSTYAFIRQNDYRDTIGLSEKLINHEHDLIHKACGWMLREAGKRDESVLVNFLDKYYLDMPRTMLRYSIERLSKEQREIYMKK